MDKRASKPKPDILFDPATVALREIMTIARKHSLLSPPEFSHLTNAYIRERPSGTQLGWLAEKLGIQPGNLQADLCNEMGWPVWSVEHFKNAATGLDCHLVNDLCSHGVVPLLTERGRNENNERSGFITVMADHGLVAPTVLSALIGILKQEEPL